jgi:hypothetical protein
VTSGARDLGAVAVAIIGGKQTQPAFAQVEAERAENAEVLTFHASDSHAY